MSSEPSARPAKPRRILFLLCFVAVCAIALAAFGILDRAKSKQEVKTWTDEQAVPTVRLVQAEPGPSERSLLLPGNVSAFNINSLSLSVLMCLCANASLSKKSLRAGALMRLPLCVKQIPYGLLTKKG